jgi:two-component system response regulator
VEALSALSRGGPAPALILLDLMLPKLSGLEVLERLRADPHTAAVPVVLFSSSDRPEDVDRAYRLGANSYVRKPVDPSEFNAAVGEVARYWSVRNVAARRAP